MSRESLIGDIGEWLIDQALAEPDIIEMFNQVCRRLYAVGVPIARSRLTWPTLHPLFRSETILWKRDAEVEFEQFNHQNDASEEWLRSPMYFMLLNGVQELRRNLDGPNEMLDFGILPELKSQGMTDYLVISTSFDGNTDPGDMNGPGIMVTWAADREGGFSEDDIVALNKIQRRLAVAVKSAVQKRIATNITETYLGHQAGQQVLDGAIKLGDGRETQAVVWYADMRRSTALADTMEPSDFLELLNDYFECTAGPAIEQNGEVLDFIGDAVLAIFPFKDKRGKNRAVKAATKALRKTHELAGSVNERRKENGLLPFEFGVSLTSGSLMFGNIGVASRLAFSVIGPTVNEGARIENMNKVAGTTNLVTREIAMMSPGEWDSIGHHALEGVAKKQELFTLKDIATKPAKRKKM